MHVITSKFENMVIETLVADSAFDPLTMEAQEYFRTNHVDAIPAGPLKDYLVECFDIRLPGEVQQGGQQRIDWGRIQFQIDCQRKEMSS